ncbi:uncharacterized protein LOC143581255 [Bidens hawaiensis]|uniref:uncharacterized protein LOC143581255 n=1 Tax=Bidens hawaiensis TaxID=980011 RepID=UPI00404970BF
MVADGLFMQSNFICGQWGWSRNPRSSEEVDEFRQLLMVCQNVVLELGEDRLCWDLDESGSFNVKSIKWHLANERGVMPEFIFKWNNWIPKKVNLVAWRAELDRLPTRVALAARNINVLSIDCAFCGDHNESVEHIIVSCGLAQAVWHAISVWCRVPAIYTFRVRDLLELHNFSFIPKKAKAFLCYNVGCDLEVVEGSK